MESFVSVFCAGGDCVGNVLDEFRNFLLSEEADFIGYQINDFNMIDS